MKQVWHNYKKWECYKNGMWKKVSKNDEITLLEMAIKFTGNYEEYGHWMMEVVKNWKYSCEHHLTNQSLNRRAYIGHAACCMAFKCPEYIVREAWKHLTDNQRELADKQADIAINYWEKNNVNIDQLEMFYEYK